MEEQKAKSKKKKARRLSLIFKEQVI
jgi:hypothetical protein